MSSSEAPAGPPSARTTVRRIAERASYDPASAHAILDEGLVCHVGLVTDDGPVVIPTLYARDGDRLLLHGSVASRLLRGATDSAICVTVTLVDGLVLARSAFHEALVPGRTADARRPNDVELRQTAVLALPLHEVSVKVRDGGAKDEPEDLDLPVWAGVLPLPVVPGAAVPDTLQLPVPDYVLGYRRR